MQDFAKLWQAADKVVYFRTPPAPSSARTRLERDFDPEAVRQLKASAGRDLTVGGADLAAQAIRAGLVDECHLFLCPLWWEAVTRRCLVAGGRRGRYG
jgi:dihydrofolate reductase